MIITIAIIIVIAIAIYITIAIAIAITIVSKTVVPLNVEPWHVWPSEKVYHWKFL